MTDLAPLEEQRGADLKAVSLSKLVFVQPFRADGRPGPSAPPRVLWYRASLDTLKMATEMHKLCNSSLVLSSWVRGASSIKPGLGPLTLSLKQVYEYIWKPLLAEYHQCAASIEDRSITLQELDRILQESGDQGDGGVLRGELVLMSEVLGEEGWADAALRQIQEYRRLSESAAAAVVVLDIAEQMNLSGSFEEIAPLAQLVVQ